jgi:hypothetical protein
MSEYWHDTLKELEEECRDADKEYRAARRRYTGATEAMRHIQERCAWQLLNHKGLEIDDPIEIEYSDLTVYGQLLDIKKTWYGVFCEVREMKRNGRDFCKTRHHVKFEDICFLAKSNNESLIRLIASLSPSAPCSTSDSPHSAPGE